MEILQCSRCKSFDCSVHKDEREQYFVECNSCGKKGIPQDREVSAVYLWNEYVTDDPIFKFALV